MENRFKYLFRSRLKPMLVTYILIAINVLVFLSSLKDGNQMAMKYGLLTDYVYNGEYYRMLTSIFLHIDPLHIAFNMIALFGAGQILEQESGHLTMAVVYLVSGIGGSLLVLKMSDAYTVTYGASGAVLGVIAACAVWMAVTHDRSRLRNILSYIALSVINTFSKPDISIGGHIGGLITGAIIGTIMIAISMDIKHKKRNNRYED